MELAGFVHGFSLDDASTELVRHTKERILDSVGCALAGAVAEGIPALLDSVAAFEPEGGATVWGRGVKTGPLMAVLCNGIAAHTVEMDDVHREAKAHAGAVVVPAALSMGELMDASGREVMEAVVCGYEVMLRIGAAIGAAAHRHRGWHATGTCGTFGGGAAAGKLMGFTPRQLCWTLGLAGTQSSGLWAFTADGAGNKKLHAGRAAQSGVLAAMLARSGMSGPAHILNARDGGLFQAMSDGYRIERVSAGLGTRFLIDEVSTKPYACCRSMHPPINAALLLRRRHRLEPARIRRIEVGTYGVARKQCAFTARPSNREEARFCLAYGVAVALMDGAASPAQFNDDRIRDENLLDLAARVHVSVDEEFDRGYPEVWGCRVEMELTDGTVLTETVSAAKGDPENPFGHGEIVDKFNELARGAIGPRRARLAVEFIEGLENAPSVRPLVELCAGRVTPRGGREKVQR